MNRHLLNFTLSVIIGIALIVNQSNILIIKSVIILFIFLNTVWSIFFKRYFFTVTVTGVIFGIVLILSFNTAHLNFYNTVKDKELKGKIIVTKEPKNQESYHSFYGKLTDVDNTRVNQTVYVTYYGDKNIELNDVVSFEKGTISLHDKNMNPGGFNYNNYYKSENAHFKLTFEQMKVTGKGGMFPAKQARELSKLIKERIYNVFSSEDTKTFFSGLFLGDKTELTPYVKDTFGSMGISHVLAVSGMHVVMIITLLGKLLSVFRRKPKIYNLILGCALFLFCFITGLEVSVIRASITAMLVTLAAPIDREYDSATALSFAALFMILLNPYVICSVSFQLSFLAALGISLMAGKITSKFKFLPEQLVEIMGVTFSATFATLPVIIKTFSYMSPLVFIGNLIIVPILPYIYVMGIISAISGFYPVIYITDTVFTFVLNYLGFFARSFPDRIYVPVTNYVFLSASSLVMITLAALLSSKKITLKAALGLICIPTLILSAGFLGFDEEELKVSFINSGQADCALLSLGKENILIDTATEKICRYEVIPFLRRKGIKKIDTVVISHFHDDHAGGMMLLAEEFEIGKITVPDTTGENDFKNSILSTKDIPVEIAKTGDSIDFGKTELKVINTMKTDCEDNNSSLILKLSYGKDSYLFTGDAESFSEAKVKDADSDVLKVGHHGSDTSSALSFLEKVSPSYAVISVGENNRYNLPDENTLARLKASGAKIHRTDQWGAIEFTSKGE